MEAFRFLASQNELVRSGRLGFTFTSIKREKDWCTASFTGHAQIEPGICLGPSRNVHLDITADIESFSTRNRYKNTSYERCSRSVHRIYSGFD
jgi:hypothetical protein